MTIHRLKIYYAPLPEESTRSEGSSSPSPAALEFCQRAARLILSLEGDKVQLKREMFSIEPLPDDASRLFEACNDDQEEDGSNCNDTASATAENKTATTTTTTTLNLFIISCAADGSVHRSVRKFARSLAKVKMDKDNITSSGSACCNHFALTLLGHARCDNSAKQMADTIYSAGWRLEKSLLQVLLQQQTSMIGRCETQVELEGPEVKFDPWIMALAQSL